MMDCTTFAIEVLPSYPPPQPRELKPPKYVPPFKCSWRTRLLAKPMYHTKKYTPPPPRKFKPRVPASTPIEDEQIRFRSDQMSRGDTRKLLLRKKSKEALMGPKFSKTMDKHIELSRKSVYNYYRERLRLQRNARLKRLREKRKRKMEGKQAKKGKTQKDAEKEKQEHLVWLSQPRKVFKPAKKKNKWKPIEEMKRIAIMASPKEYDIVPPKDPTKIASAALVYEITPKIAKLAELPDRMLRKGSGGLPLGKVSKAAMRYKITPRVEELAKPMEKSAAQKGDVDENAEHWIITQNALKYKASPRILELAKPMERD